MGKKHFQCFLTLGIRKLELFCFSYYLVKFICKKSTSIFRKLHIVFSTYNHTNITNINIIFLNLLYLLNFKCKQTCLKTSSHFFFFFLCILSQSNLKAVLDKHNNAAMTAFGYIYTRKQSYSGPSYSIQFFTLYAALSCHCHFEAYLETEKNGARKK